MYPTMNMAAKAPSSIELNSYSFSIAGTEP